MGFHHVAIAIRDTKAKALLLLHRNLAVG